MCIFSKWSSLDYDSQCYKEICKTSLFPAIFFQSTRFRLGDTIGKWFIDHDNSSTLFLFRYSSTYLLLTIFKYLSKLKKNRSCYKIIFIVLCTISNFNRIKNFSSKRIAFVFYKHKSFLPGDGFVVNVRS